MCSVFCSLVWTLPITIRSSRSMQTRSFRLFAGFGQKKVSSGIDGVNAIQRIYDSLASITDIEESMRLSSECPHISACLESMSLVSLADLGLTEDYVLNAKENVCMNIVNSREFDIQVFVIPKGKQLPLHDHPNMIVLSKLISGTLSVRSFSPDRSDSSNSLTSAGKASLTLSSKRNPIDGAWLLSPNEGNVHELIAENTAIVLDVLLPPYSEPDRPCNFYRSVERDGQWLLEDSPPPPNRQLPTTISYKGLKPTLREVKWGNLFRRSNSARK
jgi:hypothetical protein